MNRSTLRLVGTYLAAIAACGLCLASLKVPVWRLKMESPQYQDEEALRVKVYPGTIQGDLREITVLNHYIGVHIPEHLPQLKWLPSALLAAAALGLVGAALPGKGRGRLLLTSAALLSCVMIASAGLAQYQMHEIGHKRDRHAALKGVRDFTPPLIGEVKVANFEISSGLSTGALLISVGIGLQLGAGLLWSRRSVRQQSESKDLHLPGWLRFHQAPS